MVTITVFQAGVTAALVLGFGLDQEGAPRVLWSLSDTVENGEHNQELVHQSGDPANLEHMVIRCQGRNEIYLCDTEVQSISGFPPFILPICDATIRSRKCRKLW